MRWRDTWPARRLRLLGKEMQARLLKSAQLVTTILVTLFLTVPVALSLAAGVTSNYFQGLRRSGVTLAWIGEVWSLYSDSILLSLIVALSTLVVTLIIGVPAAYTLNRRSSRLTRAIEEIVTLPLAIPGLAISLALITTYGGYGSFRRSWVFILVGHVIYTLPFMLRAVMAVLASIDARTLEEGASSLGARPWQTFLHVILPNALLGIVAGSLMVVTLSIGEFNLTWMLHTPLTKTLPVGLADSYASMRLEIASAYTLVFFVMIVPLLIGLQLFGAIVGRTSGSPSANGRMGA